MAKRIVNKAERNAERYDAKETGYQLYEDSLNGKTFDRLIRQWQSSADTPPCSGWVRASFFPVLNPVPLPSL